MTEQTRKPQIMESFSLCNEDCERGYHNPHYLTCERCGAHIHVRVYEVMTAAGEELIVGRECLKDVLGYIPNSWHQKAEEVADAILKKITIKPGDTISAAYGKYAVVRTLSSEYMVRIPHRLTPRLLRAGADMGLWSYPLTGKFTGIVYVEWFGK